MLLPEGHRGASQFGPGRLVGPAPTQSQVLPPPKTLTHAHSSPPACRLQRDDRTGQRESLPHHRRLPPLLFGAALQRASSLASNLTTSLLAGGPVLQPPSPPSPPHPASPANTAASLPLFAMSH